MARLLRPLTIGDVRLDNNLCLSPMAGFTDLPFRILCRRHGAGLVTSEMVSATALEKDDPRQRLRMRTCEEERPTSIQIASFDPDEAARAAAEASPHCEVLGLNLGCPAWQVQRVGCGANLLDHPRRAEALVAAIKAASDRPLLVKMRAGNQAPIDIVGFAQRMEAAGADALALHGRTAKEGYTGTSDWSLIRAVKEAVSVPMLGNGDVVDGPSAERALASSGVDGLLVGRAARGDPRVFARIGHYLETGQRLAPPTPAQRVDDVRAYVALATELGIHRQQVLQQTHQFTRGLRGAAALRKRIHRKDLAPEAVVAVFETFMQDHLDARA